MERAFGEAVTTMDLARGEALVLAEENHSMAEKAVSKATRKLCSIAPTTAAGVAAVLRVVEVHELVDHEVFFDGRTKTLLKTLARAAEQISPA